MHILISLAGDRRDWRDWRLPSYKGVVSHANSENPSCKKLRICVKCTDGLQDVMLHLSDEGIAKITINRPEVHNAFRPRTVKVRRV